MHWFSRIAACAVLFLSSTVLAQVPQGPPPYPPPPPQGYPAGAYPMTPGPQTPVGSGPLIDGPLQPGPAADLIPPPEPIEPELFWYQPAAWLEPDIWSGSFELGINGNEGNTTAFNIFSGFELLRDTDVSTLNLDLDYANNSSGSIQTAHYALLDTRTDWKWGETPWSLFAQKTLRYDEFQNYDLRFTVNSGLGYRFVDEEWYKLKGRFGAGARRDFGGPDETWAPEAVFGLDYFYQLSERQRLNAQIDYFPAWDDFSDYRLVTDTSWEVLLDEGANLSLKVGVINNYDSTPNAARPNDLYYNILLLWKR